MNILLRLKRLKQINWFIISIIVMIVGIGILMLYSASNGKLYPWADKQILRFLMGFFCAISVAITDLRWWMNNAYFLYFMALALLLLVEILGFVGMGAQRWIDFYFFNLQPSELMRVFLVLALARYFSSMTLSEVKNTRNLLIPLGFILTPCVLVLRQPDLGTAMILLTSGAAILFVAGVQWWKFVTTIIGGIGVLPILWQFLHEYQKKRILIFLNPESDPNNAGYHITQSKIALGSGGIFGKGFLMGTQSHLNFLPEKQTDFIFTMFCEEFGLVGAIFILLLFIILIIYGFEVAKECRSYFGKLVAIGLTTTLFLYIFINIGMVMGLLPVVGIPLPFMSYGGTAMMTLLFSQGILFTADLYNANRFKREN